MKNKNKKKNNNTKKIFLRLTLFVVFFLCIFMAKKEVHAKGDRYWIKVNKMANVATAYKEEKGKWVPVRAMLTSCGGSNTPIGTYNTKAKYRWHTLYGPCYGQYCTRIVGGILFHSVWYYRYGDRVSQSVVQFNKLGSTASHGCVRMSTEDVKWIYYNCSLGTKVTIYSSTNPGPLGKPAAYKMPSGAGSRNWDPTDASKNNPYYQASPVLQQKITKISYGDKKYKEAKKLVTAKQKNGKSLKSLTIKVKKYSSSKKKYVTSKYSVTSPGKYEITYKAVGKTGVSIEKTFRFTVKKKPLSVVPSTKVPASVTVEKVTLDQIKAALNISFTYGGKKVQPIYTLNAAKTECTITFKEDKTKYVIRINVKKPEETTEVEQQ